MQKPFAAYRRIAIMRYYVITYGSQAVMGVLALIIFYLMAMRQ